MIRYQTYDVVFSEIPDETSLVFNITNCPFSCEGCHSPHLRANIGQELTADVIFALLDKYPDVTCVLFMGHGNDLLELVQLAGQINLDSVLLGSADYKKIALYTGIDDLNTVLGITGDLYAIFDYIKVGKYDTEKGPLTDPNTNQKLYQYDVEKGEWSDITYKFWK